MYLNFSWRRPLSYRNRTIDLLRKSMDWFLYDNGLRHERVKRIDGRLGDNSDNVIANLFQNKNYPPAYDQIPFEKLTTLN